jgi:hypothetical protein
LKGSRGYEYRGPRQYLEGIPFGDWIESGDHYISSAKIDPDDVELVPIDKCRTEALAVIRRLHRRIRLRQGVISRVQ